MTSEGAVRLVRVWVNKQAPENFLLHLYRTQAPSGAYEPLDGFGYKPEALTPDRWSVVPDEGGVLAVATGMWAFEGAVGTVEGWYLEGVKSQVVYHSERFVTPYEIKSRRDTITVIVKLLLFKL